MFVLRPDPLVLRSDTSWGVSPPHVRGLIIMVVFLLSQASFTSDEYNMVNEHEVVGGDGLTPSWTTTNVNSGRKNKQSGSPGSPAGNPPQQFPALGKQHEIRRPPLPAARLGDSGPRFSNKRHRPPHKKDTAQEGDNKNEGENDAAPRDSKKQKMSPPMGPTGKEAATSLGYQQEGKYAKTSQPWQTQQTNKHLVQYSGFKSKFGRAAE